VPFERSRQQWREISLEKKLAMFVAPVVVAVATAVIVPRVTGQTGGGGGGSTTKEAGLQVVGLDVASGPDAPSVDVTLRNTGDTVSVVTGAVLTVRDFGLVGPCVSSAALEPSAAYDVELPLDPAKGETIAVDLSQQLPADTADRFTLRMNVRDPSLHGGPRLYALGIGLRHDDAATPLDAGTAVVSAPHLPATSSFPGHLPEGADADPDAAGCAEENLSTYERFLALDAERPPEMTAELAGQ
jgi:hypothetical protein